MHASRQLNLITFKSIKECRVYNNYKTMLEVIFSRKQAHVPQSHWRFNDLDDRFVAAVYVGDRLFVLGAI